MGRIEGIFLAEAEGAPVRFVERVRLLRGIGLEGDRYAAGRGHFSSHVGSGRALTLIEGEVIDLLRQEHGIDLKPGETRRNLTTRGIALNELVGVRFRV